MSRNLRIGLAGVVAVVAIAAFGLWGHELSLERLAAREGEWRAFRDAHPVATVAIAFLVYVAVTGLSLPGAAGLSLVYGWLFGFYRGTVLVSFASTSGAFLAFLLSRSLLRDFVEARFASQRDTIREAFERDGAFYLFSLRLIPVFPFFLVNLLMGLTRVRPWTFWWVSQLGMLPGTAIYLYAGASLPTLRELSTRGVSGVLTPQLLGALVALGLFPLAIKWLWRRFRPAAAPPVLPPPASSPAVKE